MWNKDKQNLLGILEAIEKIEEYISPFADADEFFENTISFMIISGLTRKKSGRSQLPICYSLKKKLKRFWKNWVDGL